MNAQNNISDFTTVFNTDVASAGLGRMRGNGTGTLSLTGVTGSVSRAYLYWHGPTDSTDPAANANVTFAGQSVAGTNIGFSSDNCWGFDNSQAYRADVTSLVTGNGDFALSNFTKSDAEINGVELIVFFQDGNPANNQDVVLFDGNDSNQPNAYDADGWNVTLSGINYTAGAASLEMIVSDGQTYDDGPVTINGNPFLSSGAVFQGDSVPGGNGADESGFLWDQKNYDVTSYLTPGPNTLAIESPNWVGDCLSLVVAAIQLPAGAAPGQPPTITVDKSVLGSAPADATFTVDATCTPVSGGSPTTLSADFDSSGVPTGPNVLQVPQGSSCTLSEETPPSPPNSVSYACDPASGQDAAVCATDDRSATVTVGADATGSVATVTVTNSYGVSSPHPVLLAPRFTG